MDPTHPARLRGAGPEAPCPASDHPTEPVRWLTVAALARGTMPSRQRFRICREPGCDVVYLGDRGAILRTGDLNLEPGFQSGGSRAILCHCFLVRRGDLEHEIRTTGTAATIDRIAAEVRAGSCACEVRNPTGRCCLADLRQAANAIHGPRSVGRPERGTTGGDG